MDIEKLIERMNNHLQSLAAYSDPELAHTLEDAATALSTLHAENEKLLAENNMLRKMQPVELNGEAARSLSLALEVSQLRAELEQVKRERDVVIKELNGVSSLVDDLAEFVDREIHPVVDYNLYLDLRENVDAVSMFQHEDEWRGPHKEED